MLDITGYERIPLSDDTRFIATMNHNYAGTRELNEALLSRFAVIRMPSIDTDNLQRLMQDQFPNLIPRYTRQFALLFLDFQKKYEEGLIHDMTAARIPENNFSDRC